MLPTASSIVYCLYPIKLSKWFMLTMPIVALYYTENGLDSFDIFSLQAVCSFSNKYLHYEGRITSLGSFFETIRDKSHCSFHSQPNNQNKL